LKELERKALFFFLILLSLGLVFTPTAYADVRLGLTPAKVEVSVAGGESGGGEITVVNCTVSGFFDSNRPVRLTLG